MFTKSRATCFASECILMILFHQEDVNNSDNEISSFHHTVHDEQFLVLAFVSVYYINFQKKKLFNKKNGLPFDVFAKEFVCNKK